MQLLIVEDYGELSVTAAMIMENAIRTNPCSVLGFATGSTPVGMYKQLIKLHLTEGLDFSKVTTFNLDEYVGLPKDHPQSYYNFMQHQFFAHVNIPPENIHMPCGDAENLEKACQQYEQSIQKAGGIDIQVLGIGSNGHIGFNEPGSDFSGRTRVVSLEKSTIQANARFFQSISEVPSQAISMGIQTIMNCRQILLIANGMQKREAIRRMLMGEVTPDLPASILTTHPNVTVIIDREAASDLS